MSYFLILFLLAVIKPSVAVFNSTVISNSNENNKINDKLIDIFDKYYDEKYQQSSVACVVQNKDDSISNSLLNYIHRSGRTKAIVVGMDNAYDKKQSEVDGRLVGHLNMVFLFIDSLETSILGSLRLIEHRLLGGKRSNIVIVLQENIDSQFIMNIFHILWQQKILNVVVLASLTENLDTIGFNPYFAHYFENLTDKTIFYDKLSNLNGYTLNLMLPRTEDSSKVKVYKVGNETHYMGKDGMTIQTVLKHCNATFKVIDLSALYELDNPWRPINKNLKDHLKVPIILQHDADLIFDALEMEFNNFTDVLYPHAKDDYVVLVPKAKFRTQTTHLIILLKGGLVYFLVFFIIICPIIWYILTVCELNFCGIQILQSRLELFSVLVFNNFRTVLGLSFNTARSNLVANIFLLFILFCNLIVNNYFQSIFKSILIVSDREPEINTIKELAESHIEIEAPPIYMKELTLNIKLTGSHDIPTFINMDPKLYKVQYKDFPVNISILTNYDRAESVVQLRPVFHIVRESLKPAYVSYHVVKDSPYYAILEKNVPRILEAGLYDYWKKENSYLICLKSGIVDSVEEQGGYHNLSIQHIFGIFCVLFIGFFLGFLTFISELLYGFCKKKK